MIVCWDERDYDGYSATDFLEHGTVTNPKANGPDVPTHHVNSGRSPDQQAVAAGSSGLQTPPLRWRAKRKAKVVRRLLRGDPLDKISREAAVPIPRSEEWRAQALAGMKQALLAREAADPTQYKPGEAIVAAIPAGQRDTAVMAELGDKRLKASKATLRAALTGDYRQEHLFCLRQAHEGHSFGMRQIAEVDKQISGLLAALEASPAQAQTDPATQAETPAKARPRASASPPTRLRRARRVVAPSRGRFDQHPRHQRDYRPNSLGGDLGAFKSGKHFASWLSLCPDNRVSGSKLLSAHTKPSANRAARALRLAA